MSAGSAPERSHGESVQAQDVRVDAKDQSGRVQEAADRPARLHPGRQRRGLLLVVVLHLRLPVGLRELAGGGQRAGGEGGEGAGPQQRDRGDVQRRQPLGGPQVELPGAGAGVEPTAPTETKNRTKTLYVNT